MSNEITCKECGYDNPHSSKFCNNCGTKLPLSTHIICPNCATPNTRDRVFCDTCGTRLIAEIPQPPEDPHEDQPPPSKPFSLPARQPGDTGELNPDAVPDWLRTGDIGTSKLPPADEETPGQPPAKKDTSDLPEWLVHESDPEPIINAPTNISTEFYQDLVENAEDLPQPDDLFADEEEANLPDWLAEAGEPSGEEAIDAEAASGLTDWLSDLGESDSGDETAVPDEPSDEDLSSGLTDWLVELDDLDSPAEALSAENAAVLDDMIEQQAEEEDSSDWLTELGPAQTDIFEPESEEKPTGLTEELPGWMEELGPVQTNLLDPKEIEQLMGPLSGMEEGEDDLVTDEEAGADVSFTGLFEEASGDTGPLPEWLDTGTHDIQSFLTDVPDLEESDEAEAAPEPELEDAWFGDEAASGETDFDWLAESGEVEPVTEAEFADHSELSDTVPTQEESQEQEPVDSLLEDAGDDIFAELEEDSNEDLGWLSDMEAIQSGDLVVDEVPEETAVPDEEIEDQPEPEAQPEEPVEPEPEPMPADEGWGKGTFFDEEAVGEDLPDWLNQLDETREGAEATGGEGVSEELPEWIASMRPSEGMFGSELPGVFTEADIRDTLEGIPEELAGAELPDWLQDTPLDMDSPQPQVDTEKEPLLEIPDWLQPDDDEPEAETTVPTPTAPLPDIPDGAGSRNEWNTLLDELPPLTPLAESLPKAEIPEWVQQLKPPELTGEPPRELEGAEETAGPLRGMHGIVPVEPVIAKPRVALTLDPYVTSPEQQQQVALLLQIAQETPQTVTSVSPKEAYGTAVWLRLLVAILIIAGLLAGLRGPSLLAADSSVPATVQAVETAVSAAAGQPVLVAVEYTPAMAAELTPQAELLLAQLTENGSPVLITTQYAAGMGVANAFSEAPDLQMVGYLPGESIGLRQLGDCLAQRNSCEQLNGRLLDDEVQTALTQTELVIILTGDRDNLVNWVEQVGAVTSEVTLVAGVTQSLAPVARSYAGTGQIQGLLAGAPDTAAYAQLNNLAESGLQSQLNAQLAGQLLAGLLLLVGLLAYGTTGLLNRRPRN